VAWWLNRKLNDELTRKTHFDADHSEGEALESAREQGRVWYGRWQEEAAAREGDRVAHRLALVGLQEALAAEVAERRALSRRVDALVQQVRAAGLSPVEA
jgi:hypothetical protein